MRFVRNKMWLPWKVAQADHGYCIDCLNGTKLKPEAFPRAFENQRESIEMQALHQLQLGKNSSYLEECSGCFSPRKLSLELGCAAEFIMAQKLNLGDSFGKDDKKFLLHLKQVMKQTEISNFMEQPLSSEILSIS